RSRGPRSQPHKVRRTFQLSIRGDQRSVFAAWRVRRRRVGPCRSVVDVSGAWEIEERESELDTGKVQSRTSGAEQADFEAANRGCGLKFRADSRRGTLLGAEPDVFPHP